MRDVGTGAKPHIESSCVKATNTRGFGRMLARVSLFTFLSQVCSFASSIAIARVLGAKGSTDAYFLGLSVPMYVYGIFLGALRLSGIPALTEEAATGSDDFNRGASELMSLTVATTVLLSLLAAAIVIALLPLMLSDPGLVGPARLDALALAPLGVLGAMMGGLGAILGVRNRFGAAAIVLAIDPLLRIGLLVAVGSALGADALIIANLAGSAIAVATLWVLVRRDGIALRLRWPRASPFVRRMLRVSTPLVICQALIQVNPVVDRSMAGRLSAGSITALELGLRLFAVPMTLIGATLIGPLTATWSARRAAAGWPALRDSVNRAVTSFVTILPPVVVLGLVLRHQAITLLYQGQAYSVHATDQTADVFVLLLVGLPAQLLTIAFATLFVIEQRTAFVLKTGVANLVLNAVLDYVLRGPLGVGGIALSTSATYTIVLAAYVIAARRRWPGIAIPFAGAAGVRSAVAAALMAAAAYAISRAFPSSASRPALAVELAVVGVAVLAVYAGVLLAGGENRRLVAGRLRRSTLRGGLASTPDEVNGV